MFDWLFDSLETLAVGFVNALIVALGALISGFLFLLPDMPALPTPPDAFLTASSWVAWVFPVAQLLLVLAFVLAMWLLWNGVAIVLRWAKALSA